MGVVRRVAAVTGSMMFMVISAVAQDALETARTEARAALDEYFRAWNAADNAAIIEISNFPRVSVGGSGQVVVREVASEIEIDFDLLRQTEGWDHTTLDLVETIHLSEDKVHFKIVFSRRRADGSAYRTSPGLYVVTRQGGHWGLQLQSVLPPTFAIP